MKLYNSGLEHRPMLVGKYKKVGNHVEVTAKSEAEIDNERGEMMNNYLLDWTGTEAWQSHRVKNFGVSYANKLRGNYEQC